MRFSDLSIAQERHRRGIERRLQRVLHDLGRLGAEVVGHNDIELYIESEGSVYVIDRRTGHFDDPEASCSRRQESVAFDVDYKSPWNTWYTDVGAW